LRDGDVLGKGALLAVIAAGDAEHAAILAQVDAATAAIVARATIYRGIKGDTRTRLPLLDGGADPGDDAGGFMPHDNRRLPPSGAAVHAVNVAAADAAGLDGDQDGIRAQFRFRHVFQNQLFILFECQRFHDQDKRRREQVTCKGQMVNLKNAAGRA